MHGTAIGFKPGDCAQKQWDAWGMQKIPGSSPGSLACPETIRLTQA